MNLRFILVSFGVLGLLALLSATPAFCQAQPPQLVVQTGHTGEVTSVRFSTDGRYLLTEGQSGTSFGASNARILWDVASERKIRAVPMSSFLSFDTSDSAVSQDCRLSARSNRPLIQVEELATGKLVATLDYHEHDQTPIGPQVSPVCFLTFDPANHWIAGAQVEDILLWNLPGQAAPRILHGHLDDIRCLAVSPDGRILASGADNGYAGDHSIHLWTMPSGAPLRQLEGHAAENGTQCLAFSPDGALLASGGGKTIRLWQVADGHLVREMAGHTGQIISLTFSHDGRFLLSRAHGAPEEVKLWKVATGEERALPPAKQVGITTAFEPNGSGLAVCDGAAIWRLNPETGRSDKLRDLWATSLAYSADGCLLAAGGFDGSVRLLDNRTGKDIVQLGSLADTYTSIAFHDGDRHIIAGIFNSTQFGNLGGSANGNKLWDLNTSRVQRAGSCIFSRDGQIIVVNTEISDHTILIAAFDWNDASKSKLLHKIDPAQSGTDAEKLFGYGTPIQISDDGMLLLCRWLDVVNVIDVGKEAKRCALALPKHIDALTGRFVDSGKCWVSSFADRTLRGYNTNDGHEMFKVDGVEAGYTFFSDAQALAYTNRAGTIQFVNATSGQPLEALTRRAATYKYFASDQTGHLLASRSNAVVEVWNVATGTVTKMGKETASQDPIGISPNGKTLVTVSPDINSFLRIPSQDNDSVTLWDIATQKLRCRLPISKDSFQFSGDGQSVASWNQDGGLRLWNADTGQLLVYLVTYADGSAGGSIAVVTPQGEYLTARQDLHSIGFRFGDRAYPFEQFDLRLNRPDKVLTALGCPNHALIEAYHAAYLKRLEKMGFTESQVDGGGFHLPTLRLTGGLPTPTMPDRTLKFAVSAADDTFALDRLQVFVNDVPANFTLDGKAGSGSNGLSLTDQGKKQGGGIITLQLSAGANKVQVSALNNKGVESLRQTFNVTCTVPAPRPDLYVLTVGISTYKNGNSLVSADKDAKAIADFFAGQASYYSHLHIKTLLNEQAVRENILKARETLIPSGVDDEVIVFFAGHGLLDDTLDYYYATQDIDFLHPQLRGLGFEEIEGLLDGIPARHKMLLMDTCHAGEVDKPATLPAADGPVDLKNRGIKNRGIELVQTSDGLDNAFELQGELFADLRRGSGATVIAAARGVETAGETSAHGLFTQSVLDALQASPHLKVSELRDFVAARIDKETQGRQRPTARRENLEDDFAIVPGP